jgi:glycosyltransferase involved in cell wall biosynthesis
MSRAVPISVVVPTRNRPELLDGCLAALRASLRDIDELVVSDSASTDPLVRETAKRYGATYVRCERRGASLARNNGWRAAKHDVIAFIDDDVRVKPEWASAAAKVFTGLDIAFVTGRIDEATTSHVPALAQKTETTAVTLDPDMDGVIGHSANLIVRREALRGIGGFDELLGAGAYFRAAEDIDLFDRLFAAGYRGRYEPSVGAAHVPWRRLRDYVRVQGAYGVGSGARIAKLIRTDFRRARRAARSSFIDSGVAPLVHAIRTRWRTGIAARSLRVCGTVLGFVLGIVHPVRDGHFRKSVYASRLRSPSPSRPPVSRPSP